MKMNIKDRLRGCLLGLAVGDALGTTLQFDDRRYFTPITDMIGGGPFNLEPGEWTGGTSMALCLAASLAECNGFDAVDQMNRYLRWWKEGYMSSTGRCFDIGIETCEELSRFRRKGHPVAYFDRNHGSLRRIAPLPIFYHSQPEEAVLRCGESSKTGDVTATDGCRYFGALLVGAINGVSKDELLSPRYNPIPKYWSKHPLQRRIQAMARGSFKIAEPGAIWGSPFVEETLEAALWAFWGTNNFRDGALKAVNLGNHADTIGAVYGQIAGAFYGASAIPSEWVQKLARLDLIEICLAGLIKQNHATSNQQPAAVKG